MSYSESMMNELNALLLFNPANPSDGIKVHHDASSDMIEAVKSLHRKGLITQQDGGYLTDLGQKAAEHAEDLLSIVQ